MYNLYNLEPKFKNYLVAGNVSSVTLRNYLSDLRHFLGWYVNNHRQNLTDNHEINLKAIDEKVLLEYRDSHKNLSLPVKTMNRRLSALRSFFNYCQAQNLIVSNPAKEIANLVTGLRKNTHPVLTSPSKFTVSENSGNQHTVRHPTLFNFSHYGLLLVIPAIAVFVLLLLVNLKPQKQPLFLNTAPASNKYLSFSGKIQDINGNPVNTKTDLIFSLYNQAESGTPLYQMTCRGQEGAITPDVNGEINIVLGADCDKKPLPSSLFLEHQNIYLGIKVGSDAEMKPRQNIPNVGYANNASSIQGLEIGSRTMAVPYINQEGHLLIGTENPGIKSTYESENFQISSAESVTIESSAAGDVVLQASESGGIKLRTGGISDTYTRLTINNEGNIGIGTLFPTYGLEVNDDLKIGNGNRLILASASTDPTGENGAMYYNIQSNRFRCYQNSAWSDCFTNTVNNTVGGIYDGTFQTNSTSSSLEQKIQDFEEKLNSLNNKLENLTDTANDKIDKFLTTNYQLLTTNLTVREKIASPVIESDTITTNEIKPSESNLVIDLNSKNAENTSEVKGEESGLLASIIIKGLENKTAVVIDAAGNASFSGRLAANNLEINNNATIAGTLKAGNIESENLNQLTHNFNSIQSSVVNNQQDLSKLTTENLELTTNVNDIQKLLADIKNQPLPDPTYYQNLDNSQLSVVGNQSENEKLTTGNKELLSDLTITGKSNFYDAAVSNSLNVGNLLVSNDTILSLAWDLKLSSLSTIRLFEDKVIIAKNGNITTQGKVIAHGGIVTNKIEALNSNEPVTINNLELQELTIKDKYLSSSDSASVIASADNFVNNGLSAPALETQTAMGGTGIIPLGSQEVIIYNSKIKDSSLIYLTPTDQITDSVLSVSKKESCLDSDQSSEINSQSETEKSTTDSCRSYFKVSIDKPVTNQLTFNWLVIN